MLRPPTVQWMILFERYWNNNLRTKRQCGSLCPPTMRPSRITTSQSGAATGHPRNTSARTRGNKSYNSWPISRERFQGGCLLAEASGDVRGSVGYQIQVPQFPEVLRADVRKVGYIWTVYVDPQSRRQGVASLMVERALASLKQIGCTTAILHASEAGAPVYTRLGFRAGPEMRLKL